MPERLTSWLRRPVVLAATVFACVSATSFAAISHAPPSKADLVPKAEVPSGACPMAKGGVRLAAYQDEKKPAEGAPKAGEKAAEKPKEPNDTGCKSCHKGTEDPHAISMDLSCVDCHGGNGKATTKAAAHPKPRFPEQWKTSANPEESYTLLNAEKWDWIRFVNPGDSRVAGKVCGDCHGDIVKGVQKGPMMNSAQVYSTALYNNATVPFKDALFSENYNPHGHPQAIRTIPPPTPEETRTRGILPMLWPLPRFEMGQPGIIFRPFERGGGNKSELGNPNREDIPGQPDVTLSNRGFGTQASVDPVIIGAQKVRLNDPVMAFMGTNNAPGDYRNSGCASCHVIYGNDREVANSGPWAKYGNQGLSFSEDPTIPKNESGHPIRHKWSKSIPSSQCITCHVHNGNGFLNTYLGYMWWDEETDGEYLYPKKQAYPSQKEIDVAGRFNPEEAASRGFWKDKKFLETVSDLNPKLTKAQYSDYHGHGWMFNKVYKRDHKGNFLDAQNHIIPFDDPKKWDKAIHLKDIHLEKGMHCVDCHFSQDVHGTGKVFGDRRAAIEITCQDCHGSVKQRSNPLAEDKLTTGPNGGNKLSAYNTTAFGDRWAVRDGKLFQHSAVDEDKEWEVPQVIDTITPGNSWFNEKSRLAKTIQKDGKTWGNPQASDAQLAHSDSRFACVSCHSSWTTNCFGCHLAARVNTKKPMLHNEKAPDTQVYAAYNPQVLRTDGYMLAIDGTVEGHKVMPARSSSAVTLSVQNGNRSWFINQVPTVSAAGYNGNAFNTHAPHTVRAQETKQCTDCHVSAQGDNNAWMSSVMMLGSNQVNFMGKYIYVAGAGGGLSAVSVTERDEPQAVLGSHLHQVAYPDFYAQHEARGKKLTEAHSHGGHTANQVQLYGEYLLAAGGSDGFRVYDIANIGNKDFSQRIITSPFSAAGQSLHVDTKDATGLAIGSPSPLDVKRIQLPQNEEQPIAPIYGYAFVSDSKEGLVVVNIATLTDGIPTNNFLRRAATYNPDGKLSGSNSVTLAGNYAYVTTGHGLYVVNVADPKTPRLVAEVGEPALRDPSSVQIQFRYAFVCDSDGLKVIDVTRPEQPRVVPDALVPFKEARRVYIARTYAYVAAGKDGLALVDIERPEHPKLDQVFTGGGAIKDAWDVKVGMVAASLFAYVADGKDGLKVVELASPETVPGAAGYSPRPAPRLIAYYPTDGMAVGISEGYRRDRAVDESGNQVAVFGRRGARPFNLEEQHRLFMRDGQLFTVTNDPPGPAQEPSARVPNRETLAWTTGLMLLPLAAAAWAVRRRPLRARRPDDTPAGD
jgi:hypothetical protein